MKVQKLLKPSHHFVEIENVRVGYQFLGEGEPIILVHGLSGSTRWWVRNVQALAQRNRVYLVDLPGFGTMHRMHSRFALMKEAQWLLTWMHAVGIQKTHLVGHSMGGYICILIAAHYPEVVSRLILVSPAVLSKMNSVFGYAIPLLLAIRYLTPAFFLILAYDALRAGPLTLLRAAQDLLSEDAQEDIKKITAPTLLVWGENDTLVPPSLGHILRTQIPNSRLVILKKAAHVSMYDQPQQFNTVAEAFLSGECVGE